MGRATVRERALFRDLTRRVSARSFGSVCGKGARAAGARAVHADYDRVPHFLDLTRVTRSRTLSTSASPPLRTRGNSEATPSCMRVPTPERAEPYAGSAGCVRRSISRWGEPCTETGTGCSLRHEGARAPHCFVLRRGFLGNLTLQKTPTFRA